MSDDRLRQMEEQARKDRALMRKAAEALAEIDRSQGLSDPHADVLTALRIRVEGKERASLEDLLTTTQGISGKKDLKEVLGSGESSSDWPTIEEKKRDWPT